MGKAKKRRLNKIAPRNSVNQTRERFAQNKKAFVDVLGDPFALPDPIDGWYNILKRRSTLRATQNNFDEGRAARNPAAPIPLDFFCDVEHVLEEVVEDTKLLKKVIGTYIMGDTELLDSKQRASLEQRIGKQFRARRISPVSKYFTTIRRTAGK